MLALLTFALQLAAAPAATAVPAAAVDTPPSRARPQVVEVSEWYERRLTLHRRLSYTVLPLFAFQYTAGSRIWDKGPDAPEWARTGHRVGAAAIAGVFTVNTVTGLWNLWDSRMVEQGRGRRYMHAASMMVANAGFTWAGAVLSEQAERDAAKRRLHRSVAITSMAIAVTSGLLMKYLPD